MITPAHPTEKYILGMISFHESQTEWFTQYGQTTLAEWARSITEDWKNKLQAMKTIERLVRAEQGRR